MPPPRTSLRAFLATARKALAVPPAQRPSPLTFVVGNESADLDSLCCAVVLAYLRTHSAPHYALHIPLANLARDDLPLRTELKPVLAAAGLQTSDLLTLSDLALLSPPSSSLSSSGDAKKDLDPDPDLDLGSTRWLLVDHNALAGDLGKRFTGQVVGCVDHHVDEGAIPSVAAEGGPRVIRKSGSCMSLVVEYCRDAWEELSRQGQLGGTEGPSAEEAARWDAELAHVALAPMLIDTTDLTAKDKTAEVDVASVEFAERMIRAGPGGAFDRKAYFDEITRLREDLSGLSLGQILRKDYKQWEEGGLALGVSSVVQGLGYLLGGGEGGEQAFLRELRAHADDRGLDLVGVMTASKAEGVFRRELLLWALNERAAKAAQCFFGQNRESLGLDPWSDGDLDLDPGAPGWRRCWWQRKTEFSRKKLAPSLREAMRSAAKL